MKILFIILLIFLFGLILVFLALKGVVSFFLGGASGRGRQQFNGNGQGTQSYSNDSGSKKVFAPDEGEYVKYEEIE